MTVTAGRVHEAQTYCSYHYRVYSASGSAFFRCFPQLGILKWEKREQQIQAFLESEPVLRGQIRKIEARDTGFRAFLRLSDGYEAVLLLEQKECRAGDWVEVIGRGWQMEGGD